MQRSTDLAVRSSYKPASDNSKVCRASSELRAAEQYDVFPDAKYHPTDEECKVLASPIVIFLKECTSYDIIGASTQVAVLNIDVALSVAFIAAQETRLESCLLWDPCACVFCGTLSPTDYIEILLYCNDNPNERENVGSYTIRQWLEKRGKNNSRNNDDCDKVNAKGQEPSMMKKFLPLSSSSSSSLSSLVTCAPDTSLSDCLQRLLRHNARHIAVLAEKEGGDLSVVAMVDVQQIIVYLGSVFLSIEAAGDGQRGGGAAGRLSVNGGSPHDGVCSGDGDIIVGKVNHPLHMRSSFFDTIKGESENLLMNFGKEPLVGPYCSIFDIPFCCVSQLGKHCNQAISVTLDSPLLDALRLMLQYDIDSIAVVSGEQIIVDVIDRSDIVRIEDQGVYDIQLTVREALRSKVSGNICVFYLKDALRDIFIHFVNQRVKELFLVDPDTDKLIGQLNVAELIFFLVFGVKIGSGHVGGGSSCVFEAFGGGSPTCNAPSSNPLV